MTLDQLVENLQGLREQHGGEIEVRVYDDWIDYPIGEIDYDNGLDEQDPTYHSTPALIIYSGDYDYRGLEEYKPK